MLTKEQLQQLSQPFSTKHISWKPGATNQDKTKALGLAYVDPRHYQQRLDDVVGPDWSDTYEIHQGGSLFVCHLTIGGITRCDVGEKDGKDQNTATSAKAQAFKRACVAFGLGRYLYSFPQKWVGYDSRYKRFTDAGQSELMKLAEKYHSMTETAAKLGGDPPTLTEPEPPPTTEPEQAASGKRPLDGPTVRSVIRQKAGWQNGSRLQGEPITAGQIKGVGGLMSDAVKTQGMNQALLDKARHDVLSYLVGENETAKLTKREASAIITWLKVDGDGWDLNEYARQETANVLTALAKDAGQQEMEL